MNFNKFYNDGFQIIPNVLQLEECHLLKKKILEIYEKQVNSFGIENLILIGENNTIRSPFLYDWFFKDIFYNNFVMNIVSSILGKHAILSLQNAIYIPKNQDHHQSFYHRDIIHQEFVSSRPLAINLYYCLDDYNEFNGGTSFILGSHKKQKLDLTDQHIVPNVKAGSIILFDSMVYHKAGINTTGFSRCGINNMYTLPFIKQQINYPKYLNDKPKDAKLSRLLGFESKEFLSVDDFRNYRLNRLINE